MMMFYLHFLFVSTLVCLSWWATKLMLSKKIMDIPNARSSHSVPTPRGGGVGIVLSFMVGVFLILVLADDTRIHWLYFGGFLLAAVLIAGISFYDDVHNFSFKAKLATQLVAVVVVMTSGVVLDQLDLPWLGNTSLGIIGIAITFFWLLGMTNAYNFMDGIDGLAASTAVIASAFFAWISLQQGSHFIYLVSLVVFAGSLGFFIWNKPPAKIFMGDVGSAFLGFVFACMAIIAARYDMSHTSFLVLPMLLLHFIVDTLFTLVHRKLAGEKITEAHRTHIYQLLHQIGWSHARVTSVYGVLAMVQGAAAILITQTQYESRIYIFLPFLMVYSATACWVVRIVRAKRII